MNDVIGRLTPRQRECLRFRCRGLSTARVGARLFISENTVRNHLSDAYVSLGIGSLLDRGVEPGHKTPFACYLLGMVDGLDVIDPGGRMRRELLAPRTEPRDLRPEGV